MTVPEWAAITLLAGFAVGFALATVVQAERLSRKINLHRSWASVLKNSPELRTVRNHYIP